MGEIGKAIPKPMLPIGSKPLIEHQVELFAGAGIKNITICTGYLSSVIQDYFGDGQNWNVNIKYAIEASPCGSAGCVRLAFPDCKEALLVVYGDVMVNMDIDPLIAHHHSKSAHATLVVHPNDHPFDSDLLDVDSKGMISRIYRKPHREGQWLPNMDNACLYIIEPEVVKLIPKGVATDFAHDIFPLAIQSGLKLCAYRTAEYLKDLGTPERYEEISRDWTNGRVLRFNRKNPRPCIFIDRDGVILNEVDLLYKPHDLGLLPNAAEAIREINGSDFLAILLTNLPVIERGLCDFQDPQVIHNKLDTLLGRNRAKLDAIYFCPHYPDKGFEGEDAAYKIPCNCRKPDIGLIMAACREFNIDLDSSWLIGDTRVDLETAKRAGIRSALVKTGFGGKDNKFECSPTAVFEDVFEAVKAILKNRILDEMGRQQRQRSQPC